MKRRRRSLAIIVFLTITLIIILSQQSKDSLIRTQVNAVLDNALDISQTQDWSYPSNFSSLLNPVQDLCSALVAKHILFIGPETTYHLHNLWLDALENHQNTSLPCHGPEFCTFHHVCRLNATTKNHGRVLKIPPDKELRATNSSVLRYVLSTTLYAATDPRDRAYTVPIVDPETQVRVKNAYWLAHARRADFIIANRGPLPAPAWTYQGGSLKGNWSFADKLYLNSSTAYLEGGAHSFSIQIVNAALHTTLQSFLPSTLYSLDVLQTFPSVFIWHGSWYLHPRCHISGKPEAVRIRDPLSTTLPTDPWSLYYNAQVYMQNRVMQRIVPYYGGTFYATWIPDAQQNDYTPPVKSGERKQAADCLLYMPSTAYGKSMQEMFLSGLVRLVQQTVLEASL